MGWPATHIAYRGVRSGTGQRGALDLVLIQRLWFIVHVGQRQRDRTLARQVGVVGGSPGLRRGLAMGRMTKSTMEILLVPTASPGAAPIDGSHLLQQRRAPAKFRRCAARLAPGVRWGGSE